MILRQEGLELIDRIDKKELMQQIPVRLWFALGVGYTSSVTLPPPLRLGLLTEPSTWTEALSGHTDTLCTL